jgi:hypothetical protein
MRVDPKIRPGTHWHTDGARVFGLVGERTVRPTGLEIQPKLHTLAGQTGVQAADGFERVTVAAMIWKIHRGLQSYFGDGDAGPLEFLAYQMKVDSLITTDGMPGEMRGPEVVTDSSSMGTDFSSLSEDHVRGGGGGMYNVSCPTNEHKVSKRSH